MPKVDDEFIWTKRLSAQLIKEYEATPILWNATSPHYKNKVLKFQEYLRLSIIFNCSPECIEKKLLNFRNQYNREISKIIISRKSGSGRIYESKWFAFDSLHFLQNSISPKRTFIHMDKYLPTPPALHSFTPKKEKLEYNSVDMTHLRKMKQENVFTHPENYPRLQSELLSERRKIDHLKNEAISIMPRTALSTANSVKDEHSIYGEYIGNRIRGLQDRFLISIARNKIENVLFQLEMSLLHNNSAFDPKLSSLGDAQSVSATPFSYYSSNSVRSPSQTSFASDSSSRLPSPHGQDYNIDTHSMVLDLTDFHKPVTE